MRLREQIAQRRAHDAAPDGLDHLAALLVVEGRVAQRSHRRRRDDLIPDVSAAHDQPVAVPRVLLDDAYPRVRQARGAYPFGSGHRESASRGREDEDTEGEGEGRYSHATTLTT